MIYIDNEKINEIRNSVNIVDVISSYIPLIAKGRNYFGVCPFHDDHSPSMSVDPEKQIFKCFSCGAAGNVFTFVKDYEHVSFIEAVAIVAKTIGIDIEISGKDNKNSAVNKDIEIMNFALKYYQNNINSSTGIKAKEYLEKRGLSQEIIKEFQIGLSLSKKDSLTELLLQKKYQINDLVELGLSNVSPDVHDVFNNRIMFPLWDTSGNVVGFSGRIFDTVDTAKYVNSKSSRLFKKGELLFNYHRCKNECKKKRKIIVVEGFMDAIRLYSVGIKNVVALMGTALTDNQIDLLKSLHSEILLCLDNDDAGEVATVSNGESLLKKNADFSVIRIHDYKDPDEFILNKGVDAIENIFNHPQSYIDFKIQYLKKKYDLNSTTDFAKFISEIIETLKLISDEVLKSVIVNKIVNEYNVDASLFKDKKGSAKVSIKKEQENKNTKKLTKYNKAAESLIYLMMSDTKYIKIFEKKLGYFPEQTYRNIVNEIRYFYETNKYINLADFISYVSSKEDIIAEVNGIISRGSSEINDKELEIYIDIINKNVYHTRIQKLKTELKNAANIDEAKEITSKIVELKKGCVGNGK